MAKPRRCICFRVQSRKVSTVILRGARQPISQSLETRNLSSLSQCCKTRHLARFLMRNILRDQYFKHRPQLLQFFCKRVYPNPTILYLYYMIKRCRRRRRRCRCTVNLSSRFKRFKTRRVNEKQKKGKNPSKGIQYDFLKE